MVQTTRWLLDVAIEAFPARRAQLEGMIPADTLTDAWRQIATKAGVDSWGLAHAVADAFGLETVDPRGVQPEHARLLPERLVRLHQILPLGDGPNGLSVVLSNPGNSPRWNVSRSSASPAIHRVSSC